MQRAIIFLILLSSFFVREVAAQSIVRSELLDGEVISIETQETGGEGVQQQTIEIKITSGDLAGQVVTLTSGDYAGVHIPVYEAGDKLVIQYEVSEDGEPSFQIQDYVRRTPLVWLFVVFVSLSVLIGGKHGVRSLLGLAISFFIIFTFILPQISAGRNPVLIAVVGGTLIALVSFYISHGVNKKTTAAIVGTFFSFVITAIISQVFINWSHLSGFASDESLFLQITKGDLINIQGLILAGVIIGALGVLDDVTISQASVVQELKYADASLRGTELFVRAMRVGRDHIASLVNTLVLVYTAGALPLLLLYMDSSLSLSQFINYEIVAEEIIRTLTASIGLILAVPITTFIATRLVEGEKGTHRH